jgi:hypothetical protein
MQPKPKGNSNAEDASPPENENTAWTIIYASIVENWDIRL